MVLEINNNKKPCGNYMLLNEEMVTYMYIYCKDTHMYDAVLLCFKNECRSE